MRPRRHATIALTDDSYLTDNILRATATGASLTPLRSNKEHTEQKRRAILDELSFLATNGIRVRHSSPIPDECDLEAVRFIYEAALSLRHCERAGTHKDRYQGQNNYDFDIDLTR
jgi:hypothetical protein